jgi:hypothetical protein
MFVEAKNRVGFARNAISRLWNRSHYPNARQDFLATAARRPVTAAIPKDRNPINALSCLNATIDTKVETRQMMIALRSLNFVSGERWRCGAFVRQAALNSRMTSQPSRSDRGTITAVRQWASNGHAQSKNQADDKADRRELR